MYILDVNICVSAIRPETQRERTVFNWLQAHLQGPEAVGILEFVLSSMTRIVTQHRLYDVPSSPQECMDFADALLRAPSAQAIRPGPRHWEIFSQLVTSHQLRGNDVPDAYLASIALEQGATFVTLDRGFARFEGLRIVDPLA